MITIGDALKYLRTRKTTLDEVLSVFYQDLFFSDVDWDHLDLWPTLNLPYDVVSLEIKKQAPWKKEYHRKFMKGLTLLRNYERQAKDKLNEVIPKMTSGYYGHRVARMGNYGVLESLIKYLKQRETDMVNLAEKLFPIGGQDLPNVQYGYKLEKYENRPEHYFTEDIHKLIEHVFDKIELIEIDADYYLMYELIEQFKRK